jgi:hypothetical protein
MGFQPQGARRDSWVNPDRPPPRGFIAATMELTMMSAAQRDGELIADLASERAALREAQMVRVRRLPAANEARLRGHISDVVAVANAARLR